jgi:hypothetical protein
MLGTMAGGLVTPEECIWYGIDTEDQRIDFLSADWASLRIARVHVSDRPSACAVCCCVPPVRRCASTTVRSVGVRYSSIARASRARSFARSAADHFVFSYGSPLPADPTRHVIDIKHGWETLRKRAKVSCRLHDLRHTFATRLAENGVSESTMLSLMGHMSRSMLERYSHIRMAAKRDAVAGVTLRSKLEISEAVPVKVPVSSRAETIQ